MSLHHSEVMKRNKVGKFQKWAVFSWNLGYPGSVRWMTEQGLRDLCRRMDGRCRAVKMYPGDSMRDVYLQCFLPEVQSDVSWWLTCQGF
jgi:hypothetical protein